MPVISVHAALSCREGSAMNYKESVAYIQSLVPTLERPTLARIKLFMGEENDIQNEYKCFHVGGTNGKGSTATILETILASTGLKVGKFTGPHIMRFNERFAIGGKAIDDHEFAEIATIVRGKSDAFASRHEDFGRLTWFEFLTAMAFFFFAKNKIDCAVLEVGLGGRFDATNIAENVAATIITNIDLDHTQILGDTVEKIAFEKAGIMRNGVPVITGAKGAGLAELKAQAIEKGAILISLPDGKADYVSPSEQQKIDEAVEFLSLSGPHQKGNAELAIVALLASKFVTPKDRFLNQLADTLKNVYFPGRMQCLNNKILIMDGAHNPAGAKALRQALDERLAAKRSNRSPGESNNQRSDSKSSSQPSNYCFILGFFGNKNAPEFLKELLRKGDRVIAVEAEVRRSTYPKEEIVARCAELGIESTIAASMSEALKMARVDDVLIGAGAKSNQLSKTSLNSFEKTGNSSPNPTQITDNRVDKDGEVVVTGSFAVLNELMLTLGWQTVDDGRDFALRS
jgi:dihydrofolate synthase / folylpolyglutamate synthase